MKMDLMLEQWSLSWLSSHLSTIVEMIQSIIPVGEIITSAILAIGIAAAIGWEKGDYGEIFVNKKFDIGLFDGYWRNS